MHHFQGVHLEDFTLQVCDSDQLSCFFLQALVDLDVRPHTVSVNGLYVVDHAVKQILAFFVRQINHSLLVRILLAFHFFVAKLERTPIDKMVLSVECDVQTAS
jgi:hypothetical protein